MEVISVGAGLNTRWLLPWWRVQHGGNAHMAAGSSHTSSMHSIAAQSDLSHALWTYALATSRGGTPQSVLESVEDANVAPATLFGNPIWYCAFDSTYFDTSYSGTVHDQRDEHFEEAHPHQPGLRSAPC